MPETKKSQLLNSLRRFLNDIKSVSCDGVKKDVNVVSVGNVNLGVFYDSKGFAIPNDDYDRLSSGDFSGMIELEEKVLEDDCEGIQSMPFRFGEYSKFEVVSYSTENGFELKLVEPVIVEKL